MSERERLRGILLDMDGVLYTADNIISGAVETAAWVRAQGIPHLFVTNTTSKSRAALADKLLSFGIPAQQAEILTPPRPLPNGCMPGKQAKSLSLSGHRHVRSLPVCRAFLMMLNGAPSTWW